MNDQTISVIRWAITIVGSYLAQRGIISNSDLSSLTAAILGIIGPATMLATALWGWYSHSHAAKIAAVNSIPGVKVVLEAASAPAVTAAPAPKN